MTHAGAAVLWELAKSAYPAPGEPVISRWIQRKITSTT
jgi:hypothetical protein